MKQTAVEYIREKLLGDEYWYENMTFDQIIDKAKEIEKWQIMEACYTVLMNKDQHNMIPIYETKEEEIIRHGQGYYNITFKKNEI